MADNVAITAGLGTSVATDDVAGVHYQKVKLDVGGDGVSLPLSNSNPIPVSDGGGSLTVDGNITLSGSGLTALQLIDDIVQAEDAPHASGAAGVMALAVRKDSIAALAGSDLDYAPLQVTSSGSLRIAIAEDSIGSVLDTEDGSVNSGQSNVALVVSLPYQLVGNNWLRGGSTPYTLISAASTNATNVKVTAGVLCMCVVTNVNAAVRFIKFYNKASAPTVGSDTPVLVFAIPGATTGGGVAVPIPAHGINFSTGISYALTTGIAHTDTGAVGANDVAVSLAYL